MNLEVYRQFGIDVVQTAEHVEVHLDSENVHRRVQQFLCELYQTDPHSYKIFPSLEEIPEVFKGIARLRMKQDGRIKDYGEVDPKPPRWSFGNTIYTSDLPAIWTPNPDYIVLFHGRPDPLAYPIVVAHEMTHGEHASFHIGRTVPTYREYTELFSVPYVEYLASLVEGFLTARLDISENVKYVDENVSLYPALGYKLGRERWKDELAKLPEEEVRETLAGIFKKTDDEIAEIVEQVLKEMTQINPNIASP